MLNIMERNTTLNELSSKFYSGWNPCKCRILTGCTYFKRRPLIVVQGTHAIADDIPFSRASELALIQITLPLLLLCSGTSGTVEVFMRTETKSANFEVDVALVPLWF